MTVEYSSYAQMLERLNETTVLRIVNNYFETIQKRKDYNTERSNDPIVQKQRRDYQKTRNAKIKRALEMLKEREEEEGEEES